MLLEKIDNFDNFRAKMDSTKEVLHAIPTFTADISYFLSIFCISGFCYLLSSGTYHGSENFRSPDHICIFP